MNELVHKLDPRKQKRRRKRAERGVALIMVLGAIAILTVMLAEFQEQGGAELSSATLARDELIGEYAARSAISLSRLLIASEPTLRTAIAPLFMLMKRTPPQLPVWDFTDRLLGAFNDEEGMKDFGSTLGGDLSTGKNLGMKGARFELVVVDEDSKINANQGASNEFAHRRLASQIMSRLAPVQYSPIFEKRDENGNTHDRLQICAAIIDWADTDEQAYNCDLTNTATASTGTEDAWYQLLAQPYKRKNAPYDSLDELHMVRGMGDDFWATFVDPDPANPKKREMTVWGQGKVNVNTANAQTLWALVCSGAPTAELCTDPAQMGMFISGITLAKGISMGAPIFGSEGDFVQMMEGGGQIGPLLTTFGMKPVKFQSRKDFASGLSIESKIFSLYAVGVVKGYRRQTRKSIHEVVDFRGAPGLTGGSGSGTPPAGGSSSTPPAQNTNGQTGANATPSAIWQQPNIGGQVLYFRID